MTSNRLQVVAVVLLAIALGVHVILGHSNKTDVKQDHPTSTDLPTAPEPAIPNASLRATAKGALSSEGAGAEEQASGAGSPTEPRSDSTGQAVPAEKTGDDAKMSADGAKKTADEANKTADGAKRTADEAKKTADEAKKTADGAKKTADEAKKTADGVKKAAAGAKK